jgi:hypothetical protein
LRPSVRSYELEPVARGLQFAGSLSGGRFFKSDFSAKIEAAGVNGSAYAAALPAGRQSIVILNKDLEKDLEVSLDFGKGRGRAVEVETLRAPSLDSREARIAQSSSSSLNQDGRRQVSVARSTGVRVTVF